MSKIQTIIDTVKELSVIELSELVKAFEEEFGVSAAAPVAVAVAGGAAADPLFIVDHIRRISELWGVAAEWVKKNFLFSGLCTIMVQTEERNFVYEDHGN